MRVHERYSGFVVVGLGSSYECHDIIVRGFVDFIVLAQ
jgi:hypothetical protein